MLSLLYKLHFVLSAFGLNLHRLVTYLSELPNFFISFFNFRNQLITNGEKFKIELMPCLYEKNKTAGSMTGHYFHQDLYVASKIFKKNPQKHLDIGSRIDGFVSHVASYRHIEIADIRPLKSVVKNISFIQLDLMAKLGEDYHNYCDSLSCLHAIEHFGLGRYGDNLDVDGHLKGLNNLHYLLKNEGILYLSFPIGKERTCFNAHRILNPLKIIQLLDNKYVLEEFSYIDDKGKFHKDFKILEEEFNFFQRYEYSCGIFQLKKISL